MQKLLSIAIPTWNRAKLLEEALSRILPQIKLHKNDIELIISDNNSSDNTQSIITKYKGLYQELEIIDNLQSENTGYYGNFRKCKELSSSKYVWILADDQFVNSNIIPEIIRILKKYDDLAVLHLYNKGNKMEASVFKGFYCDLNRLLKYTNHKITGISYNIINNNKSNDIKIFERYKYSSFIGFHLLLNTINFSKKSYYLEGDIFTRGTSVFSFNFFNSFIEEISVCIQEMKLLHFANEKDIQYFVLSLFKYVIGPIYEKYKIKGKLNQGIDYGDIKQIEKRIKQNFYDYIGYKRYFIYRKLLPKQVLYLNNLFFKIFNKILRIN